MHYPGCKRAHKHGAAGSFVGSGRRRNPTRGINYDALRKKLMKAENDYEALQERYSSGGMGVFTPKQLMANQSRQMKYRIRMGQLSEKIRMLHNKLAQ